jgi:two-component sensor histidine kinase
MKRTGTFLLFLFSIIFTLTSSFFYGSGSIPSRTALPDNGSILFYENYEDGDCTNNPAWQEFISQACAPQAPTVSVVEEALRFHQSGAVKCGNYVYLQIDLDIHVSDSTMISFDVKTVYSSVDDGAGYRGIEYPIIISLGMVNSYDEFLTLMFCYNYRGGESHFTKDVMRVVFPNCPQGEWLRNETFRIRDYFPDAMKIYSIKIQGSGWDYESYVDNIMIYDNLAPALIQRQEKIANLEKRLPLTAEIEKVDLLLELVDLYEQFSTERSLAYAEEALELSKTIGYYHGEITAGDKLGAGFQQTMRLEKAIEMYWKQVEANRRMGRRNVNANFLALGKTYLLMNNYDSAMFYFTRVVESDQYTDENTEHMLLALKKISNIHFLLNDFDEATAVLDKLLVMYESEMETNQITEVINEKARIFMSSGNLEKSAELFLKLLEIGRKTNNMALLAKTFECLGDISFQQKKYAQAIQNHKDALDLHQKSGNLNCVALTYFKLAGDYLASGRHESALESLNKSVILSEMKSLDNLRGDIYHKYSEVYSAMGNHQMMHKYYNLYLNLRNQLYSQHSLTELAEMRVKYETEKMDQEINMLKKEREIQELLIMQRSYMLWVSLLMGILILLIVVLIYRRYRSKQKANLLLTEQKEQLENRNNELNMKNEMISNQNAEIEKQMNEKEVLLRELHHRVKNNLQIIYSMLNIQARQLNDPEAVAALRSSTNRIWAMALIHHKLYLDKKLTEIKIDDYISDLATNIQDTFIETKNNVNVIIDVEELSLEADIAIPLGLIVNELMINAMKHAFVNIKKPQLEISLKKNGTDTLVLKVADNGIGLPKNIDLSDNGTFGIELINLLTQQLQARLEVLNQRGTCFKLSFEDHKYQYHEQN